MIGSSSLMTLSLGSLGASVRCFPFFLRVFRRAIIYRSGDTRLLASFKGAAELNDLVQRLNRTRLATPAPLQKQAQARAPCVLASRTARSMYRRQVPLERGRCRMKVRASKATVDC